MFHASASANSEMRYCCCVTRTSRKLVEPPLNRTSASWAALVECRVLFLSFGPEFPRLLVADQAARHIRYSKLYRLFVSKFGFIALRPSQMVIRANAASLENWLCKLTANDQKVAGPSRKLKWKYSAHRMNP